VSRHQLPTKSPRHRVVVGWDPPLRTYFCQVFDLEGKEEDQPFVWLGADLKQVSMEEVLQAISPYAAAPLLVVPALVEDRRLNRV
jgi:hypothetical protein